MDPRLKYIEEKIKQGEEFNIYESMEGFQYLQEVMGKCHKYNSMDATTQYMEMQELIKSLFHKTGEYVMVTAPFYCTIGENIEVGENFQCSYNVAMQDLGGIKIGDNAMLGPNVSINTSGHVMDAKRRIEGWSYAHPITIGDNVFIGAGSILCSSQSRGLNIGNNVFIGAGSVVTKDLPDNVLAAGNPCRVIRELTNEELEGGRIGEIK